MEKEPLLESDTLASLQLRIARRADQLVGDSSVLTPLNLHCWFIAESQIMGDEEAAGTPKGEPVGGPR